jgi:hypothetical protein
MRKAAPLLLALLFPGAAAAGEEGAPSTESGAAASVHRLQLPPIETFRLFPQLAAEPRLDRADQQDERRLFHQPGDPDSLFSFGRPSLQGELHLLAAVEVNEIFLKAIPPDPLATSSDTRPRAAGSFLPIDGQRRPYQLRLGARLVW